MKIETIEKIEGEAYLEYKFKNNTIKDVYVKFSHFRGIENILIGKNPLDALVVNPRICGICGHAHLIATVNVLEKVCDIIPPKKAIQIREITRYCEIMQNHIKWFYFVIFNHLNIEFDFKKVHNFIVQTNKLISLFAGQWPHSSYAIVGGVTCDITNIDLIQAKNILNGIKKIKKELFGDISEFDKDIKKFLDVAIGKELLDKGQSFSSFISFSDDKLTNRGKILNNKKVSVNFSGIKEGYNKNSFAKNVKYKNRFYETGPLARMILKNDKFIKNIYKKHKSSFFTRVIARIYEVESLLFLIEENIYSIDLDKSHFISSNIKDGFAQISVEAARGSLIHSVKIEDKKISSYNIITPTQWNLSNGDNKNLSIIQKAIIGLNNTKIADLIFRSFDICSVCTTH